MSPSPAPPPTNVFSDECVEDMGWEEGRNIESFVGMLTLLVDLN